MRKKSHILLARYLADQMQTTASLQSHRKAFCLGSILPDIKPSFITRRHEFYGTFEDVKNRMKELADIRPDESNQRVYWRRFGEVIHYMADYFTFPHNKTYTGSFSQHNHYEKVLKNRLKECIQQGEAYAYLEPAIRFADFSTLIDYIEATHEKYLNKLRSVEEDIRFIPVPDDVVYVPSVEELEALDVAKALQNKGFGGIPIEIGYCNGHNKKLNAVEYHRSSEINVAVTDLVLLIGSQQDITDDFTYDTSKIEAFLVPAGTGIEVYATTLHYAPCNVQDGGFQCVVVLPAGTNTDLTFETAKTGEDSLLTAKNKWLIAHEDAAIEGAVNGLRGENITID